MLLGVGGPHGHGLREPGPGDVEARGDQTPLAPRTNTPTCFIQIGGRYVSVSSILNNPNTDPHTFESSPKVAEEVSAARLIVQNGAGYDDFMSKIESASPSCRSQGDRGAAPSSPSRRCRQPASLVRTHDHAGGGQGDGGRPVVP